MADRPLGRRARQAQQTHDEILQAARRLFAETGYARTTVRQIAAAAGVSTQTVYDSVGSKQALVEQLNDLIDEEAEVLAVAGEAMASGDPAVLAALPARVTRAILETCGDIVHAVWSGAAAEPDLAAVQAEGHRRHLGGARRVAVALDDLGALRPGTDVEAAGETLAVLSDISLAVLLRDSYGWSHERIEAWVVATTTELVLTGL
ncbi:TetR/AcrR family transcriptional regulator [Iamia sp. SCSIO 61187]|uniref:TetR/AcrR family transcriptional regulator n=1 Tax=Iamia sp. SCSIO 61187 TaxID=2722752 RepID=UPI001C6395F6|nr:TetR/AcrR family transcriptional regulator [Iamia sp. SCSIO 61187]QYG93583.1 TetR/AcrR family transcriptional regulator [Iamia sp. SCSIO 61187]